MRPVPIAATFILFEGEYLPNTDEGTMLEKALNEREVANAPFAEVLINSRLDLNELFLCIILKKSY